MKAKHIPNILSVFRILLSFAFAAIFIWWYPEGVVAAAIIFVVAGASDVLDGILARRFGWISNAGKILDPLADKLMQCISLLCLGLRDILPLWIFILIVLKEVMMGLGAVILYQKHREIGVSKYFGKAYTVIFYAVVFVFLIAGNTIGEKTIATYILCAVMAATGFGALALYYINYLKTKPTEKGEKH
ncbi:MAG: CDP-alcohol phosphatidyltransferase family protein [Clostridia bacterium]|nr:CDP-alcohol phosphatidyltransferase family protein [Clostridia bacterium]